MARYSKGRWINDEIENEGKEEELKQSAAEETSAEAVEQPKEPEKELPAETAEEQTWKKRYGDLRTHSNKLQSENESLKKRLADLEAGTVSQDTASPVSKEEVSEWMRQNPDAVAVIEEIMAAKYGKPSTDIDERLRAIEEKEKKQRFEDAKRAVLAAHPDFPTIARTKDFADWVSSKVDWVRDALYAEDDIDVKAAVDAINWYKAEKGLNKKPATKSGEEAAKSIPRKGSVDVAAVGDKRIWKESEIAKLSTRDFEKYEDELEAARRERRIEFDITGASR